MNTRKALAFAAGALITITVALALGVIALLLLAIWGDPDLAEKYVSTAFVLVFTAIATGGAGSFMLIEVGLG